MGGYLNRERETVIFMRREDSIDVPAKWQGMPERGTMGKERVLALSDGVIAIIITIMVLDFKHPESPDLSGLRPLLPVFLGYVLSFVNIAIYWNNHHHMFAAVERVNGAVLWANAHLLFWLSLFPLMTVWLGQFPNASWPAAAYGIVLLCASIAYGILLNVLLNAQGPGSLLAKAVGSDLKGKLSTVVYAVSILCAFIHPWIADAMFTAVALVWLSPDTRIEKALATAEKDAALKRAKPRTRRCQKEDTKPDC